MPEVNDRAMEAKELDVTPRGISDWVAELFVRIDDRNGERMHRGP